MIRILCWNLNGIRACFNKGLSEILSKKEYDILCFQETKAWEEQLSNEILDKENIFEPGDKEQLKEKIIKAIKGELKMSNTWCLTKMPTKEQYLQAYKKSWENCGFVE